MYSTLALEKEREIVKEDIVHVCTFVHVPGSVAEMREPKRREGMMVFWKSAGMGLPVASASFEPSVSKLV